MKQYFDLVNMVLKKGDYGSNRTKINAISYFGTQSRYDLTKGFPLLTTKKVNFNAIVHELLWFIKGDTNIKYLVDNNVKIWNEWPYEKYKNSSSYQNETLFEFVLKIKNDNNFASKWGDLGPVYGKQWRNFNGIDQLSKAIEDIKNNSRSRRIIVNSWNVSEIDKMALPPCHCFYQFYVDSQKRLSCNLYQRSADIFLGVPFNIASYALLTHMVAQVTNTIPYEFIHTIGIAHIYENHMDAIKVQLERDFKKLPNLKLNFNIR
ncbi:MAG: thymidylate synthase, partial [Mycoplasma sp.]|nr:thymidylate synthase [Mycoplasma sp.]